MGGEVVDNQIDRGAIRVAPLNVAAVVLVLFVLLGWLDWFPGSPWLGAILVLVVLWVLLKFTFQFSQRRRDRFAKRVAAGRSGRPFSLYLRSFEARDREARDSEESFRNSGHRIRADYDRSLEVALESCVRGRAPLVALRRRDETHRSRMFVAEVHGGISGGYLGAGRAAVEESDWRRVVERCLAQAQIIFFVPEDSENLLWEAEAIIGSGQLEKTAFVMPPIFYREGREQADRWTGVRSRYSTLGLEFPGYSDEGCIFVFRGVPPGPSVEQIPWVTNASIDTELLRARVGQLLA